MEALVARVSSELTHTHLGTLYAARGDLQRAARHLHTALEIAPGYPAAVSALEELDVTASGGDLNQSMLNGRIDVTLNDTDTLY
jgi:Tfp pilus assembly protein PilF